MMRDEKLVAALKNDDKEALGEIMDIYSAYAATVARNFSRGALSPQDIDEVSVEAFYKLWRCRGRLDPHTKLSAYISAIVRNTVKNRFRSLPPDSEDISELETASDYSVEREAELADAVSALYEGLKKLPARDREIFCRYYFFGENTARISEALSSPKSTVCSKLRRSRDKLRKYLTERGFDYV